MHSTFAEYKKAVALLLLYLFISNHSGCSTAIVPSPDNHPMQIPTPLDNISVITKQLTGYQSLNNLPG